MKTPSQPKPKLTTEEFEVRIWGFVVVAITVILFGIVFALLYSVTFVTQPIKSMAPIDQAYAKMLNDIVLLIVGGIGGIVGKRAVNSAQNTFRPQPPMQGCGNGYGGGGGMVCLTAAMPHHSLPMAFLASLSVLCLCGRTQSWMKAGLPVLHQQHHQNTWSLMRKEKR